MFFSFAIVALLNAHQAFATNYHPLAGTQRPPACFSAAQLFDENNNILPTLAEYALFNPSFDENGDLSQACGTVDFGALLGLTGDAQVSSCDVFNSDTIVLTVSGVVNDAGSPVADLFCAFRAELEGDCRKPHECAAPSSDSTTESSESEQSESSESSESQRSESSQSSQSSRSHETDTSSSSVEQTSKKRAIEEFKRQVDADDPPCRDRDNIFDCFDIDNGDPDENNSVTCSIDNILSSCQCIWDVLSEPNNAPDSPSCPADEPTQCCWPGPCNAYTEVFNCILGGEGEFVAGPQGGIFGLDSIPGRCTWDFDALSCSCTVGDSIFPELPDGNPETDEDGNLFPIAPFDCICNNGGDLEANCELTEDEEAEQPDQGLLNGLSLSLVVGISNLNREIFEGQCPQYTLVLRGRIAVRLCRYLRAWFQRKGLFTGFLSVGRDECRIYTPCLAHGRRFSALADEFLTEEDLAQLEPLTVVDPQGLEIQEPVNVQTTASAASAAASIAAIATGVAQLL